MKLNFILLLFLVNTSFAQTKLTSYSLVEVPFATVENSNLLGYGTGTYVANRTLALRFGADASNTPFNDQIIRGFRVGENVFQVPVEVSGHPAKPFDKVILRGSIIRLLLGNFTPALPPHGV
jgi:hypothetical protein